MKKITILALHLGYGGIEKCITSLANALSKNYNIEIISVYKLYETPPFNLEKNIQVKYLLKDLKPNKEEFKIAFKHFRLLKCLKLGLNSLKILYLRKTLMVNAIKGIDADIVISTRDIFDKWLGKYGNTKILKIGWEHNHYHGNMKYANKIVKCTKKLDYLVLVSKDLKEFYEKKCQCTCTFIPNMIDHLPNNISNLDNNNIISIGRLAPEKGTDDLIKVFKNFCCLKKDWHLNIIGDGPLKDKVSNLIKTYNLDNVVMHGFRNKDYINDLLLNSSIYVMCSHTESFGIVLIEAMSFGIPCIAFDSAEGACDIIENKVNGFLINDRNYVEMAKKINLLANNYNMRKEMGINARKTALKYTKDKISKQWIELFDSGDKNG